MKDFAVDEGTNTDNLNEFDLERFNNEELKMKYISYILSQRYQI